MTEPAEIRFRQIWISYLTLKMVQDFSYTYNGRQIYDLSNVAIFNDLEGPLTPLSRSLQYLMLNMSETVILIGTYIRHTQGCHFE